MCDYFFLLFNWVKVCLSVTFIMMERVFCYLWTEMVVLKISNKFKQIYRGLYQLFTTEKILYSTFFFMVKCDIYRISYFHSYIFEKSWSILPPSNILCNVANKIFCDLICLLAVVFTNDYDNDSLLSISI